ncbi:tRNA 2-selenouridine(34) synthase MnmH [Sulfitobacter sp. F26204]|uniref:tRNA 2-selenouridine(34) synthase MnmH n=1 Tax=Sulfitobacter sp. F26204 TaxID=2996014 RepID=UPI00225DE1A3|nr:tRNA 2-selenouridine(34) synthase MnmH [Sulfitobacter sp. F26204]MCX7558516.1 tRNA 2-selenouridine(34) synthase MnmH [Sulfitobacter sp. F26204]
MTPFILNRLADLQTLTADTIIDVRAPCEFARDHIPGAINLPVLDDAERAQIGTIYARISPFHARKTGGALVAQNTARHLQGSLAEKDGAWQPLVYCWRGGQRSAAFATILDQIGWRVRLLQGGYQSYRRAVVDTLYEAPVNHRMCLIQGGTGTAKTALLHHLARQDAQILDLEGLAAHRGSLFGSIEKAQPAQKMFESSIAAALGTLDPDRITFVEAESSKIGARLIPPALWTAMNRAAQIRITAPITARAEFLCRAYGDLTQDAAKLAGLIDRLRPYHSASHIDSWHAQARNRDWVSLAAGLISAHYDPRYAKSTPVGERTIKQVDLPDLDEATLAKAAKAICAEVT